VSREGTRAVKSGQSIKTTEVFILATKAGKENFCGFFFWGCQGVADEEILLILEVGLVFISFFLRDHFKLFSDPLHARRSSGSSLG
jgi:hypothetical protein